MLTLRTDASNLIYSNLNFLIKSTQPNPTQSYLAHRASPGSSLYRRRGRHLLLPPYPPHLPPRVPCHSSSFTQHTCTYGVGEEMYWKSHRRDAREALFLFVFLHRFLVARMSEETYKYVKRRLGRVQKRALRSCEKEALKILQQKRHFAPFRAASAYVSLREHTTAYVNRGPSHL
jgi:hypothetical protein